MIHFFSAVILILFAEGCGTGVPEAKRKPLPPAYEPGLAIPAAQSRTAPDSDQPASGSFEAAFKRAVKAVQNAFDAGGNCDADRLRAAADALKNARKLDAQRLIKAVEAERSFDAARNTPLFLNAVYGQNFSTAPSIEPYLINKVYQTSCPGSFYCPIQTLELLADHTYEYTFHQNGDEYAACLDDPDIQNADCRLEIATQTGIWQVKNRELTLFSDKKEIIRTERIDRPGQIGGLFFPDPNGGSTEAEDDYRNSCLYIPE